MLSAVWEGGHEFADYAMFMRPNHTDMRTQGSTLVMGAQQEMDLNPFAKSLESVCILRKDPENSEGVGRQLDPKHYRLQVNAVMSFHISKYVFKCFSLFWFFFLIGSISNTYYQTGSF